MFAFRVPHLDLHLEYMLFPPKLRWFYLSQAFRTIAISMVSLFVPVFLYLRVEEISRASGLFQLVTIQDGPSLYTALGVIIIAVFYAIARAVSMALLFPLSKLMHKYGLIWGMIIGNLSLLASFVCLLLAEWNPITLVFASFFTGLEMASYWVPYYTVFSAFAELDKLGEEVSGLVMIEKLGRVMAPVLGAMIATVFGFQVLYVTGVILMILAINAIFMLPSVKANTDVRWKEFERWIKQPQSPRIAVAFTGRLFELLALLAWPVFVFEIVKSISVVGFVASISGVLSLLVTYFTGVWLSKHRGRFLYFLSGFILSFLWLIRLLVRVPMHILAVDAADRMIASINQPIFDVMFIKQARLSRLFHFFTYREIILNVTALVFWLVVIVFAFFGFGWYAVFVLAALGTLMSMVMPIDRKAKIVAPGDGNDG